MAIYRKGDQVTLTAVVKYDHRADDNGDLFVDIEGHYSTISVPADKVTMKRPAFKVGDCVAYNDGQLGKIVGLSFDLVWVVNENSAIHHTLHIDDIGYAEVSAIAEAA